jgi:CRP-like cAMP-binding protein
MLNAAAFEQLRQHLSKRIELTDEEFQTVCSFAECLTVKKKSRFLTAGEVCHYEAYIVKGCMREFVTDDDGHENVVHIATEDWWVGDMKSFLTGQPASFFIEALEDCELIVFERHQERALLEQLPKMERFFKLLIQNAYIALQTRMVSAMSHSAEKRYLNLVKKNPHLELRVAQHHIASYLGITPEALSRVKRKIIENDKSKGSMA